MVRQAGRFCVLSIIKGADINMVFISLSPSWILLGGRFSVAKLPRPCTVPLQSSWEGLPSSDGSSKSFWNHVSRPRCFGQLYRFKRLASPQNTTGLFSNSELYASPICTPQTNPGGCTSCGPSPSRPTPRSWDCRLLPAVNFTERACLCPGTDRWEYLPPTSLV